ncbi:cytochrome P450 3A41-like [Haemaphysalis longicornis]
MRNNASSYFSFYNGAYPVIIVKDLDLIKNVLIKDFANFHGRGVTSGFARTHHINKLNIQNACGQRWKEMRSLLSPAFTTRNMKKMIGLMEDCTLEFLGIAEALEARAETFEARELFQRLTADIILRSAFGLKSNVQQKPADSSIGEALYQHSLNHFEQFRNSWRNYLIESKMSTNYSNKKKRFLTNEEIVANGHVFFVAGFETTGTTLSFMSYLLAKHQDIQDRLREEVLEVLKRDGSFTYDNAFAMNYLDQVISETLRLYAPIVGFVTRSCDKDYMHNNVTIPAGTSILVPVHHLGRDPDFWDEPDKFDPDRFGGDRKHSIDPMVYQPFGQGPRNCIGLRFAQMEIKLTMAKLLAKYRIVLDERHMKEEDLEVGSSFTFAYPQNGVWLKLQRIN